MNVLRRVAVVATLSLALGLGSCSNDANNEPQSEPKGIETEFSADLALEATALTGLDEDGLKAISYDLNANGNSVKPKVKFTEGQMVPVLCVIRNEAGVSSDKPVIVSQLNMTYKGGQLVAQRLPLNIPGTTNLVANPNGWRMICIVGFDSFNSSIATFASSTTLQEGTIAGASREFNTLYMNKDKGGAASWTKLNVIDLPDGRKGFQAAEVTQLASQGSMFIFKVKNVTTRDKSLNGLSLQSNTLAFGGNIEGLNTTAVADGLPKFVPSTNSTYTYRTRLNSNVNIAPDQTTDGYYVVYAIPDADATTNTITVTPRYGINYLQAKTFKYTIDAKKNNYYSLGEVKLDRWLTHPIEALLVDEYNNNTTIVQTERNFAEAYAARQEGADFDMPSQTQAFVLFPGLVGSIGDLGNEAFGYASFNAIHPYRNNPYWRTKPDPKNIFTGVPETIQAFGETHEYTADYKLGDGNNVSYGLRFKGGNNNEFFSAYRYERIGTATNPTGIKITVRTLGPTRTSTQLADISNEAFWSRPLEDEQKEIVRIIPEGKYWTSTTYNGEGPIRSQLARLFRVYRRDAFESIMTDAGQSAYVSTYQGYDDRTINGNKASTLFFTQHRD